MFNYTQIIITLVLSFIIAALLGPVMIPLLKRIKAGQSIREEGPESHYSKSGTPTIGGIIIILGTIIAALIMGGSSREMWILIFSLTAFGLIGFIDDFIKVVLKRNLGLRAYQKIIMQFLAALLVVLFHLQTSGSTFVLIPFIKESVQIGNFIIPEYLDLGAFYIPFMIFVIIATVNSVNLTDGLDGLASGVSAVVAIFFALFAVSLGFITAGIFSGAIAGACLGFLIVNANPAKVFMGDTGSLALGGGIVAVALLTESVLLIPIVGGIFFLESLSVIIQVISFKLTGKRVFKMSPIHHHFEMIGWKETKVVAVFWTATTLLAVFAVFIIR
jgi:phospho-N-acetylmuramoyl-pentapeptide-transferase